MKNHTHALTTLPAQNEYPEPVAGMLRKHHQGVAAHGTCEGCASPCCSRGGFAILENVMLIYERYRDGGLERLDYQFDGGLSFKEFVNKYFDVECWSDPDGSGRGLMMFHIRSLGPRGNVVAIPPSGSLRWTRDRFFDANPWVNRGCIFLSESLDDEPQGDSAMCEDAFTGRHCLLHEENSTTHLGAKPVDCVFYTCGTPLKVKRASEEMAHAWLAALAESYPESRRRFEEMA